MIKIKLKEIIDKKKITLTEIHQATGISKNTLSLIANGSSKGIQFDTLDKLLSFLNVDLSTLIEYKNDFSYDLGEFSIDYKNQQIRTALILNYKTIKGQDFFPLLVRFEHAEKTTSFIFFEDEKQQKIREVIISLISSEAPRDSLSPLFNTKNLSIDGEYLAKIANHATNNFFETFMLKFSFNFFYAISRDIDNNIISISDWNKYGNPLDTSYIFSWTMALDKPNQPGFTAFSTHVEGDKVKKYLDEFIKNSK